MTSKPSSTRGPKSQAEVDAMNADPQAHIDEMIRDLLNGGWEKVMSNVWMDPMGRMFFGPYKAWTIWAGVEMKKP